MAMGIGPSNARDQASDGPALSNSIAGANGEKTHTDGAITEGTPQYFYYHRPNGLFDCESVSRLESALQRPDCCHGAGCGEALDHSEPPTAAGYHCSSV